MANEERAVKSTDVRRGRRDEDADVAGSNTGREALTIQELADQEDQRDKEEVINSLIKKNSDGRTLVKMERKNASWTTHSGVIFTQEHPFQLVPNDELEALLNEGGFRRADPKEVVKFYKG